jgi:signal transduction histidine kinase/ActR/RegA family two-component response regulator
LASRSLRLAKLERERRGREDEGEMQSAVMGEPPSSLSAQEVERRALAELALRHLTRLQRVSSALSEVVSLCDVCQVLRSELAEALAAERAFVALVREPNGLLMPILDTAEDWRSQRADVWQELERAYQDRESRWPTLPSRLVALPLTLGPRALGAVAFELERACELEPGDRALFEDLVRPLALALDRARLYELARQECDRAEEANRAKDEFLAILGHELRNPLAPILTALELMRVRAGDVALEERGVIERQLHHMVRLVDDLLDVARITRGALRLSRNRVELARAVERAIEMASPMLDARGHRLTLSVQREGLPVDIDTHRIAQAIANLLMNSAKYTPSGGNIELSARRQNGRVLLDVRDDGIGIEPALLSQIFEPFVQRKQASDRSHGGLGLGLTIARRLLELHGGAVAAASAGPGCGSTFSIDLALASTLLASDAGAASASNAAERVAGEGGPALERDAPPSSGVVRVLVVDDNVDAAEMLAEALRVNGHVVGVAHDGPAALSLVGEFQPDLALLDIGLPVMDGFDLAQRLKRRLSARPPKFVAITGYGQPSDRARSKQAGFDEHLVKPVDLARLDAIVRGLSRHSEPAPPSTRR